MSLHYLKHTTGASVCFCLARRQPSNRPLASCLEQHERFCSTELLNVEAKRLSRGFMSSKDFSSVAAVEGETADRERNRADNAYERFFLTFGMGFDSIQVFYQKSVSFQMCFFFLINIIGPLFYLIIISCFFLSYLFF